MEERMIISLAIILGIGTLVNKMGNTLRIPGFLFLLGLGVAIGPFGLNLLDSVYIDNSSQIRSIALIVILMRAGLGLSKGKLNNIGRPALLMSCVPGIFEGVVAMGLAMYFLEMPFAEAGMLGFILAAVSPAVVVPMMLKLERKGLGVDKNIPTLILAGASLDDVVAITIVSLFSGIFLGGTVSIISAVIRMIIMIIGGIGVGVLAGYSYHHITRGKDVSYMLSFAVALALFFLEQFLPIASLLSVMSMAYTINALNPIHAKHISQSMDRVWNVAKLFLFILVGASVDPALMVNSGLYGIAIVLIALMARLIGVFISLIHTELTFNERLFCAIAYIPKATVQAAMGGFPLALGAPFGTTILAISVLAIFVTTPLGAIGMNQTAEKLLESSCE